MIKMRFPGCWFLLCALPSLHADTFIVSSIGDSGPGSLREAILEANKTPAPDVIEFNLPGDGPYTISPLAPLPRITAPLAIDATTQPGFAGQPVIELEGSSAGNANGLHIAAPNCTVRGFVINRFGGAAGNAAAILLDGRGTNVIEGNFLGTDITGTGSYGSRQNGILISNSTGNRIGGTNAAARNLISGNGLAGISIFFNSVRNAVQGNLIGTDLTGTAPLGNGGNGITVSAANCTIGGADPAARNVISANLGAGIQVTAAGSVIQGNLIGTDVSGSNGLGNQMEGIIIENGSTNVVGGTVPNARNVISANRSSGIAIRGNAAGTQVQGNYIGTDILGAKALRNSRSGILITARNNVIGGTNAAARNLISGNAPGGIDIVGNAGSRNQVLGNWIGIDATGAKRLSNLENGILLNDASSNVIGAPGGGGNVISGNNIAGIEISGDLARNNIVQANRIGTDATGVSELKNNLHGIVINNRAAMNTIGGTAPDQPNLIAFNGGAGVFVESGSGNAIRGNSIFDNAGLAIDLAPNGLTPNDSTDSDSGANELQNFPVLTGASAAEGKLQIQIQGTLSAVPGGVFAIDFFGNPACDPARHGEGQVYLGSTTVVADAQGKASFDVTLPLAAPSVAWISATATDVAGNTSEFSGCWTTSSTPPLSKPSLQVLKGADGIVTFSWPASLNVALEMTESLTAPIRWSAVTNMPSISAEAASLPLKVATGARFFRLRSR